MLEAGDVGIYGGFISPLQFDDNGKPRANVGIVPLFLSFVTVIIYTTDQCVAFLPF